MFQTPTTRVWKEHYDAGRLGAAQRVFWEVKPPEELYDLDRDPDEVQNLAEDPAHAATLARLRGVLREHVLRTRDLGFLPEPELHSRSGDEAPYDFGRDDTGYPLETILDMADMATHRRIRSIAELKPALRHEDGAVRYWAAVGLLVRGGLAVSAARTGFRAALINETPSVQIAAAEALGRYGTDDDVTAAIDVLVARASLDSNDLYTAMMALNALDYLDQRAQPVVELIRAIPRERRGMRRQFQIYVPQLLDKILSDLAP